MKIQHQEPLTRSGKNSGLKLSSAHSAHHWPIASRQARRGRGYPGERGCGNISSAGLSLTRLPSRPSMICGAVGSTFTVGGDTEERGERCEGREGDMGGVAPKPLSVNNSCWEGKQQPPRIEP